MTQYSGPERVLNNAPRFRNVSNVMAATLTLTPETSDYLYLLNKADGIAIALPSLAAAEDVGIRYRFVIQTTFTSNLTITAQAGDLLYGNVFMVDTDSSNAVVNLSPDAVDDLILTCNGTTTGGLIHSVFDFEAISTTGWLVTGTNRHTSNVSTPFS